MYEKYAPGVFSTIAKFTTASLALLCVGLSVFHGTFKNFLI
jgi:hypothetical protein